MYVTVLCFIKNKCTIKNKRDSPLKHDSMSCKEQCKGPYLKKKRKDLKTKHLCLWLQILIRNMACVCFGGSILPDNVGLLSNVM